ncbi:MAG: hypothetical protein H7A16_10255 [Sinobacteraceae bacterium]|nr:hypothetical protein [Nevskiaceae bacterium]
MKTADARKLADILNDAADRAEDAGLDEIDAEDIQLDMLAHADDVARAGLVDAIKRAGGKAE